jgi:hypothetical protein
MRGPEGSFFGWTGGEVVVGLIVLAFFVIAVLIAMRIKPPA